MDEIQAEEVELCLSNIIEVLEQDENKYLIPLEIAYQLRDELQNM